MFIHFITVYSALSLDASCMGAYIVQTGADNIPAHCAPLRSMTLSHNATALLLGLWGLLPIAWSGGDTLERGNVDCCSRFSLELPQFCICMVLGAALQLQPWGMSRQA